MVLYDILVLGCRDPAIRDDFVAVVRALVEDSGLSEDEVAIHTSSSGYLETWNPRRPTAIACFSAPGETDLAAVEKLMGYRVPIIPIALHRERFEDFPVLLQPLNGVHLAEEPDAWAPAAVAVLECIGLLRRQRRLFVSYRRTESREAAVQLHDTLTGHGFDVFLDTHSIRPGKVFQDDLWQQLCDSDVVIVLDTETYFDSKWTREEFGRAQASGIYILRLVWPNHTPTPSLDLAESIYLVDGQISDGHLLATVVDDVAQRVERLRARSLSARFTEITGKLSEEVQGIGARIVGTGAYRTVSIEMADGSAAWVYPVIGVPTAVMMNDVATRAKSARHEGPYLVYDHSGIADAWLEHLLWLDTFIPEVDFMRVSDAGTTLLKRGGAV